MGNGGYSWGVKPQLSLLVSTPPKLRYGRGLMGQINFPNFLILFQQIQKLGKLIITFPKVCVTIKTVGGKLRLKINN